MKKRIIFTLALCILTLFSSNVFATQETTKTDKELVVRGTLELETSSSNSVTPKHIVLYTGTSSIYQNYGNVGGQGYTQCTSPVEELRIVSVLYEGTSVLDSSAEIGYNTPTLFAVILPNPYDSSKQYHVSSTHYLYHDGQQAVKYSYKYL